MQHRPERRNTIPLYPQDRSPPAESSLLVPWIVAALILGGIILTGMMNANDIDACIAAGHSAEACYATFG